jgi:VWFA-related protein
MSSCFSYGLVVLGAMSLVVSARAQTAAAGPAQPEFRLQAHARIVLTDVTVTDRNGHPVQGLPRAAFHIFDNNRPEPLASFEEHTGAAAVQNPGRKSAPGTFSNEFLRHPPPVFNVIFLDTTTINIIDQMYLNEELNHFVKTLPADQMLAVYMRRGEFSVLLQDFTADHALLLAAIHKAIPFFPLPTARYMTDYETLQQIALYLGQFPGRKNVMWFSGGSNLFLRANAAELPVDANLQPIYDELEAARIAIYPIDARGLTIRGSETMDEQHGLMEDVAQATGGQAFLNTNGLAQAAARVLDRGASFYTLTYSPHEVRLDNKWHKVKVKVEGGPYTLSYRRGYFDDGMNLPATPGRPRTRLMANGQKADVPEAHSEPIVFHVQVTPASEATAPPDVAPGTPATPPKKKNETTYSIEFIVPAAAFSQTSHEGKLSIDIGMGVLAVNGLGHAVSRIGGKMTLTFAESLYLANPRASVDFHEEMNLPRGDDYLYAAVWDRATGRLGTVQVPLTVTKPVAPKR